MNHEDIRIPCTIGGRNYLACGFLKAGEHSVFGQTMLDRTRVEGTTGIDDGEWAHLLEHQKDFKKYQGLDPYYLVTERRSPDFPRSLSCLRRAGEGRYEDSRSVGGHWDGIGLVLRRCTSETRKLESIGILDTCIKFCSSCGEKVKHL